MEDKVDKKHLLVISNHNPDKWSESQKEGWDKIEYIPFPEIPANASSIEAAKVANGLKEKITDFYRRCVQEGAEAYLNLQGEYTLSFMIYSMFKSRRDGIRCEKCDYELFKWLYDKKDFNIKHGYIPKMPKTIHETIVYKVVFREDSIHEGMKLEFDKDGEIKGGKYYCIGLTWDAEVDLTKEQAKIIADYYGLPL